MSRWIDADALIDVIKTFWDWETVNGITATAVLKQTISDIKNEPYIDIVRCKECKHNPKGIGWVSCPMTGANTRKPNDFCSYGEPKGAEPYLVLESSLEEFVQGLD